MSTVCLEHPTANDDQLARLLTWLDSPKAKPLNKPENRRSARRRLRLSCQVHYASPSGDEILETRGGIRNVSKLGIGLIVPMPFAAGTEFRVAFDLEENHPVFLTGIAVFSRPAHLGWYMMGVRFEVLEDTRLSQSVALAVNHRKERKPEFAKAKQ